MLNTKTVLSMMLLALPLAAQAKPMTCPFTDYFTVTGAPEVKILNAPFTQGNLLYSQHGPIFFTLSCLDSRATKAGDLYIEIGKDNGSKCTMQIHDGPYVMNPKVSGVDCIGDMEFKGMNHKFGTYTYDLTF